MHNFSCRFVCLALLLVPYAARGDIRDLWNKQGEWFKTDEARTMMANIIAWQVDSGGWPKNIDSARDPVNRNIDKGNLGSFDNHATVVEMRLLGRAYTATQDPTYKAAFDKGLNFIFKSQHPSGGWPQSWPPDGSYHDRITFNDGANTSVLRLLIELRDNPQNYGFMSPQQVAQLNAAFEKGIDVILKCQIRVDGKLTAWCAQHDEKTFAPVWGRSFEPPSISGGESVGLLLLLMDQKNPPPRMVSAIEAGVHYFADNALRGFRFGKTPRGRVVTADADAPPIWARFHEIGTNRPIFANRKSEIFYNVYAVASPETPDAFSYAYFEDSPSRLFPRYEKWRADLNLPPDPITVKPMTPDKTPATQPAPLRAAEQK